jgi:DNA-binding transcriptional MerR regulator
MSQRIITPSAAALTVGVDTMTIRRWCEWHKEHLSASANPAPGSRRFLTLKDLETLSLIKELRQQGLTTVQVNEQLQHIDVTPAEPIESLATVTDSAGAQETALRVIEALQNITGPLAARVEALERQQTERRLASRDMIIGLAVGAILSAVFFLIIVLLMRLG